MSKKSFVLYHDTRAAFDALENASAGELIKAIFAFQAGEEVTLSPAVMPIFAMLKAQFIRDADKYQAICKARAEAGRRGGQQKAANAGNEKQDLAIASNCQHEQANPVKPCQTVANLADSDSDSDSEINKESILKDTKESESELPLFPPPKSSKAARPDEEGKKEKSFKQWTLSEFTEDVGHYPQYSAVAAEFCDYWTEKSASGKMRFQMQTTWETSKRLANWQRKAGEWNSNRGGGRAGGKQGRDYTGL